MTEKMEMICGECGGSNVTSDASAEWDVESQDWVLRAVYDEKTCEDCDMSVDVIKIKPSSEAVADEQSTNCPVPKSRQSHQIRHDAPLSNLNVQPLRQERRHGSPSGQPNVEKKSHR